MFAKRFNSLFFKKILSIWGDFLLSFLRFSKKNIFNIICSMKSTEFPLKKTFEQDFISEKWDLLFTLTYEQATMEEYHNFFSKPSHDQMMEVYRMIKSQIKLTWMEKVLSKIFWWYRGHIERALEMDVIIQNVLANRFRTYESIYESVHWKKKWWSSQKWLFSANLSIICQKYCISPTDLFKNYTLEQFMWLQDGVIFNMNMTDKEWQAENQIALVDKEEVKRRAEETRRAFEEAGK